MRKTKQLYFSLGFAFFIFIPDTVMAWGGLGHKVVAYIAQDSLTNRAKNQINELLALENHKNIVDISTWADKHREDFPEFPFHTVRIPLDASVYNTQRDCLSASRLCVVIGLEQKINLLNDKKSSPQERLQALKLVVHFLGDIHQPLHASAKTGVPAVLYGQNLTMHAIWDSQSVDQFGMTPRPLSKQLEINLPNVVQGTPEDWANEGHQIALGYFKPLLDNTPKGQPIKLQDDYLRSIAPVVRLRLQEAGVRLGRILNSIFDH